MYLDISRLEEGTTILDFVDSPESYTAKDPTLLFVKPISVHIVGIKTGNHIIIIGTATARMQMACSRCLDPVEIPVQTEFTTELRPQHSNIAEPAPESKKKKTKQYEPESEDIEPEDQKIGEGDVSYYTGEEFDLSEETRQYLELSMPMQPLCLETCLGLCPTCGANLNKGKCGCQPVEPDHPFAVLKQKINLKSKV
jgi:uncharacterized protein